MRSASDAALNLGELLTHGVRLTAAEAVAVVHSACNPAVRGASRSFPGHPDEVEITYQSLNDDSLEGLRMKNKPVFSVQFHPEAAPGPHDAHDIFADFFKMVKSYGSRRAAEKLEV